MAASWSACQWSSTTQQAGCENGSQLVAVDPFPDAVDGWGCRVTVGPAPLCSRRASSPEWPAHRRTNQDAHWAAFGGEVMAWALDDLREAP